MVCVILHSHKLAVDCKEEGSQAVLHQDSDQQYGDSHSFCSMYQCSFCHEECFASKVSQCLTLSLDVEKQKGKYPRLLYMLCIFLYIPVIS